MISPFSFASTPHIHFAVGSRALLPDILTPLGSHVLLVTGSASFDASALCQNMVSELATRFQVSRESLSGEPSPTWVDDVVARYHHELVDVVLAIGGGSAVDAGKAVAGLLPTGGCQRVIQSWHTLKGWERAKPLQATPRLLLPYPPPQEQAEKPVKMQFFPYWETMDLKNPFVMRRWCLNTSSLTLNWH